MPEVREIDLPAQECPACGSIEWQVEIIEPNGDLPDPAPIPGPVVCRSCGTPW